jgi:hypothetical protein
MADRKDHTEARDEPTPNATDPAEVTPPPFSGNQTPDMSDAEIVELSEPADRTAAPHDATLTAERDDDRSIASDPEERAAPYTAPVPPPPEKIIERIERRGGFVPMLLGGVLAAGTGFGMARYVLPDDFPFPKPGQTDLTAALDSAMSEAKNADLVLAGRIEKLEVGPDLSGVVTTAEAAKTAADAAGAAAEALAARLDDLAAQVSDLAARPATTGADPAAVAAYETELAKLQAAMAEQRTSLEALVGEATAERAAAQMTEQQALVRSSITRITIALENGGPFAAELSNLTAAGIDVPAALTERAAAGVPTLAALREAYPQAARAALAAARAGGTEGGFGSVLTSLLGARSLEPREGDDPDAILSRSEAALRDGRMNDALAEVERLPEAARMEMTGWREMATERATALAAVEALAAQASAN